MNNFRLRFQQLTARMAAGIRQFMAGRYGMDKLNMAILWTGVICSLLSACIHKQPLNLIFWGMSYVLMILSIFRILSRNTYKRYQENRKFLQIFDRLKDRQHRYFDCPKCRQMVRVPRGKGKIAITCPRCREKFVKKT